MKLVNHFEARLGGPTQVKFRVMEVGICGTDREIARFQYGMPPVGSDYLVIGHECIGQVTEVGSAVEFLKPGDLVVPMVRRPCGDPRCQGCVHKRQDFCSSGGFTERGIKQAHGFMTEFVVDDESFLNRVPQFLADIGVLTEPLTIAEKGLEQAFELQKRLPWFSVSDQMHAVVLGAGPVGLLGAMVLLDRGFHTAVYSREPRGSLKDRLVRSFGGTYVSSEDVSLEQLSVDVGPIDWADLQSGGPGKPVH